MSRGRGSRCGSNCPWRCSTDTGGGIRPVASTRGRNASMRLGLLKSVTPRKLRSNWPSKSRIFKGQGYRRSVALLQVGAIAAVILEGVDGDDGPIEVVEWVL